MSIPINYIAQKNNEYLHTYYAHGGCAPLFPWQDWLDRILGRIETHINDNGDDASEVNTSDFMDLFVDMDDFSFREYAERLIGHLESSQRISAYFAQELRTTVELSIEDAMNEDELVDFVSHEFANECDYEEQEIKAVFVASVNASKIFWTTMGQYRLCTGNAGILTNGLGAITGVFDTPISSVLLGAASSVIANELDSE